MQNHGQTVVYVAQSGDGLLGALAFSDSLRDDALEVVAQLQALGLTPMVLSGDSPAAVAAVAAQAGIPPHSARGAFSPAEKAQVPNLPAIFPCPPMVFWQGGKGERVFALRSLL